MEAAANVPGRPRGVTVLGWIWLVVAALQCLEGLVGLAVWKVSGLDEDLPTLSLRLKSMHLHATGTAIRYAVPVLLTRIVVGGFYVWASFELLRLKPWARKAILTISVLGILAAIGIGILVYTSSAEVASLEGVDPTEVRRAGAAAGAFVFLLLAAFFGATITTLHRPAVRGAFENAA